MTAHNFEEFVRKQHGRYVGWVARKIPGGLPDAEELVQDAWVVVASEWEELDSPEAYAYAVLANKIKGHLRATEKSPHLVPLEGTDRLDEHAFSADPLASVIQYEEVREALSRRSELERSIACSRFAGFTDREIAQELGLSSGVNDFLGQVKDKSAAKALKPWGGVFVWHFMIENLTPRQRDVMSLAYYEGLKPKDIALRLGITPNSARAHLSCAKASIAAMFGGDVKRRLRTIENDLRGVRWTRRYLLAVQGSVEGRITGRTFLAEDGTELDLDSVGATRDRRKRGVLLGFLLEPDTPAPVRRALLR